MGFFLGGGLLCFGLVFVLVFFCAKGIYRKRQLSGTGKYVRVDVSWCNEKQCLEEGLKLCCSCFHIGCHIVFYNDDFFFFF